MWQFQKGLKNMGGFGYSLKDDECIGVFNIYTESSQLNAFAREYKIVHVYQTAQFVTVIYKEKELKVKELQSQTPESLVLKRDRSRTLKTLKVKL